MADEPISNPIIDLNLTGDGAWADLLDDEGRRIIDAGSKLAMTVLDAGMASGRPSVAIRIDLFDELTMTETTVIVQTSLRALASAVRSMQARFEAPGSGD